MPGSHKHFCGNVTKTWWPLSIFMRALWNTWWPPCICWQTLSGHQAFWREHCETLGSHQMFWHECFRMHDGHKVFWCKHYQVPSNHQTFWWEHYETLGSHQAFWCECFRKHDSKQASIRCFGASATKCPGANKKLSIFLLWEANIQLLQHRCSSYLFYFSSFRFICK